MITRSIPPTIVGEIARGCPIFVTVVIAVIAATGALGWLLTRWQVLPGTTAVWGSSPGAATAMMLMAAAYGADIRLVAFLEYLRVLLVAFAATDPDPDGGVRRPRGPPGRARRHRSTNGVSRHQSGCRSKFGGDYRHGEQRRCGLRYGYADRPPCPRSADWPQLGEFHCEASWCRASAAIPAGSGSARIRYTSGSNRAVVRRL